MSRLRLLQTEAARNGFGVIAVGVATFVAAAAVGLSTQIAQPMVHDEFSYLLAADTFASGRLANPPHPLAPSFETFHVIESPTYASKYPPAQGFFLALGQWIGGAPILGAWLSAALMSAAIAWMLIAYVPLRWALLGGLLAAGHFGAVGTWPHSYWGGAVAAFAGALALGALARVVQHHRPRDAVILALGILLLANSRPFEGILLCIPIGIVLARDLLGGRDHKGVSQRVILPLVLVLFVGLGWMGYYNARVTGDPLKLPYVLYEQRTPVPAFTFLPLGEEPPYRDERIRKQQVEFVRGFWDKPRAIPWLAPDIVESRLIPTWKFYFGWSFTIPLLLLPLALRKPFSGLLLSCIAIETAGGLVTTYTMPHYLAPMTGAVVGLVILCLRELDALRANRWPIGRVAVAALVAASLLSVVLRVDEHVHPELMWSRQRAGLIEILSRTAHRHLILVDYPDDYPVVAEWVYNEAEIDKAPVVWARSMGPEADRAVARHYPLRQIWRLHWAGPGKSVLGAHALGDGRGPFPYERVLIPWKPRNSWNAFRAEAR